MAGAALDRGHGPGNHLGQLCLTKASLTNRVDQPEPGKLASIRNNVEPELNNIDLYLINGEQASDLWIDAEKGIYCSYTWDLV